MTTQTDAPAIDYRPAVYLIILLGLGAAALAAVLPHYTAGYKLDTTILLALMGPFVLYGMLVESLRGLTLLLPGLVLLAVTLAVIVSERYVHYVGFADGISYWLPLLVALIVLPLAYLLGERPRDEE